MTTTPHSPAHPVDPTGPLTIGSIPDADLGRLIAATVPAASVELPPGFMTDDDPDATMCAYAGPPHAVPGQQMAAYATVILDRDGRMLGKGSVRVEVGDDERNLTMREARAFACAITAAADDLLAANPTQPLDGYGTVAILAEIQRRSAGPGALRAAIEAADPAELNSADRAALIDLIGAAFEAAGVQ